MKPFSKTNNIRYSSGLFFNWCLFVMIGNEVNIVAYGSCGSPEEESINPPSHSVSVLFFVKNRKYFNRHSHLHFSHTPLCWIEIAFLMVFIDLAIAFVEFEVRDFTGDFLLMVMRRSACYRRYGM